MLRLKSIVQVLSANRLTLWAILVLCVFDAAIVWLAGQQAHAYTKEQQESRLTARTQVITKALEESLAEFRSDVIFLSKLPPISGMVRASLPGGYDAMEQTPLSLWQQRLQTIFSAYAQHNANITQVRLIGIADAGRELVRVDRLGDTTTITPDSQLRTKGDRDYFQATAYLGPGKVHVSDITLNREDGKLQQPIVPTLRVATPIFDADGKLFGMVVINIHARVLQAPLQDKLPPQFVGYLTNSQGDFLFHPDAQRSFGFELGHPWRWNDAFQALRPAEPGQVYQDYVGSAGTIHATERAITLDANDPSRVLHVIMTVPNDVITSAANHARAMALLAAMVGSLLVGGFGLLLMRQRRRADAQQAQLAAIVESSHDAIIGKTLQGQVLSWNAGAERIFGFTAAQAVGHKLADLIVPPALISEEIDILQRIGQGEVMSSFNTVRQRRDGTQLDVSVTVSPIYASSGQIVGVSKTVRDISAQKAAEDQVHALNANLEQQVLERTAQVEHYASLQRTILSNAPYAIIATDTEGIVTLFNPAAEHMLGYTAQELLGQLTPVKFHVAEEIQARALLFSQELGTPIAAGFEALVAKARRNLPNEEIWTYVRKDGSRFPVLLSVSALRQDDGAINGFLGIASDISLREQNRRELVSTRDQLLTAATVAELGIWTWHLSDNSLVWNERMYQIYGLPLSQQEVGAKYEDWYARVHPDDVEAAAAQLITAIEGHNAFDTIFRIVHSDGSIRFIQAAALVERDEKGQALRMLGINRDITQQHETQELMRSAKLAADRANQAKSEFVANMSHEIRSPMNAILGMLQLLQRTPLDEHQQDYATKAESSARALLDILNDILDFSKVEAGKLALDLHPFNLDKLLRDMAVILSANLAGKEIELLFDADPALPKWVVGDALRLQQILLNLVGNAIKFTARGEVVLSVACVAQEPAGLSIAFTIRDTGIGISPEQCQHIFQGFVQAEASTTRRYGGSGLGLAICQRLVQLMGGKLTVDSVLGQGSSFQFTITLQPIEPQLQAQAPWNSQLQHLNCLVVDDHPAARQVLVEMVASLGWQADIAENGVDALAAMARRGAEQPYDVVFIDWRMPALDGWETSKRIRQKLPHHKTPLIVMLTTYERELLAHKQTQQPGVVDGVLIKPITASMLFDAVANVRVEHLPKPLLGMPAPGSQRLAGLRLLLVEDNLTNQQVASELLSLDGAQVEVAGGGEAALEAVQRADPPFNAILMDVQMPGMDGYTATRSIRAQFGHSAPPIIAMTANAMAADREAALAAGMVDHVSKPFSLSQLVAAILRHARPSVTAAARPEAADPPGWNSSSALARLDGNTKVFQYSLLSFADEMDAWTGQLQTAVAQQGHGEAARLLHTLKGLAGTVGADQLATEAAQAEEALAATMGREMRLDDFSAVLAAGRTVRPAVRELAARFAPGTVLTQTNSAPDTPDLRTRLAELIRLLDMSNLEVFSVFEQLQQRHGAHMSVEFTPLRQALEKMEFAQASRFCTQLLRHLETGPT
ncbi:PAS domain S-box-containing protein [Rhodoferax ferrireducens]|uniref:histidine kinase n=1 Tax=Rhodoferax ferrireducens TaxID=192843 RepID=A0ABU2CBD7_9BURK|nr:PAS domain S-box protein [Rhodoferax ferrireducens]MDR7378638.1 PAS domain S-box-containing protein [Rhodoferax ferrireducens]